MAVKYIDFVGGSDSNTGATKSVPWKRCPKMVGFGGGYTPVPGDRFIFKGGVTWPSSCFGMVITASGTSGSPIHYETDPTWFSGTSWTRAVFDFGYVTLAGGKSGMIIHAGNIVLGPGLDIKNQLCGINFGEYATISSYGVYPNIRITGNLIRDWRFTIPTQSASRAGGIYADGGASFTVDNCELHQVNSGEVTGACVYGVVHSYNNHIHHHVTAFQGGAHMHHNLLHDSLDATDTTEHANFFSATWPNSTIHHNLVYNSTTQNGPINIQSSDVQNRQTLIYNNVFFNTGGQSVMYIKNDRTANASHTIQVYNNTVVGTQCFEVSNTGTGYKIGTLKVQNNHYISRLANPVINSSLVTNYTGPGNDNSNVIQTDSVANGQGYTVANFYQPTSSGDATVGGGVVLNSIFTDDRLGNVRGTSWDRGAYEWGGTAPPPPPPPDPTPNLSVSPATITFPSTAVGSSATPQSVTISNTGTGPGTVNLSPAAPFSGPGNTTVPAGSNVNVNFGFQPTSKGNHTASLTIGSSTLTLKGIAYPIAGLSFEANAGVITAPLTDIGSNHISQSVTTDNPLDGGRMSIGVTIPTTGDYYISTITDAPNEGANSYFVNFDSEPTSPTMIWDVVTVTNGYQTRIISWRGTGAFNAPQFAPKVWTLTAGVHELIFRGREPNTGLGTITVQSNAPVIPPAPAAPANPTPANGATGIALNSTLSWTESTSGTVFNVYLGTVNPPPQVSANQSALTYSPSPALSYATIYYWKVQARLPWSSNGQSGTVTTDGPVWSFTTAPITPPPNQPPNSNLSSNKTSGVGPLAVNFTLTSSDADGTVTSGIWNNGIDAPETILTPAASVSRSKTYPAASVSTPYTTSWKVTDNDDLDSTTSTVVITVSPTPVNQPPHAGITANPTASFGPFQATATLTSSDPDGSVVSGVLDWGDGSAAVVINSPGASIARTHTYASVAVDTVRTATYQTTDNSEAPSTIASVAITVKAAIQPPTVVLTTPVEGTIYVSAPATINFAATATAGTNSISKVEFYINGVKVDEDSTAPYTGTEAGVTTGAKVLTAKVLDNQGTPLTGTSPTVNVTVLPAGMALVPQIIRVT